MAHQTAPTASTASTDQTTLIKTLYHTYRHTTDLNLKGQFFSPTCIQICRPTPSYAATTREQIVQYLRDAQEGKIPVSDEFSTSTHNPVVSEEPTPQEKASGVYTIRPLLASEFEFSTADVTAPVGFSPEELRRKAEEEEWVGMRVDLWERGGRGLLVKVQYWWRLEEVLEGERAVGEGRGREWKQCLHDIMYLGPSDGTEGKDGLEILE